MMNLEKPVIPVMLEGTHLPYLLAETQYVDASGDWQVAFQKIAGAVASRLREDRAKPEPPVVKSTPIAALKYRGGSDGN